MFTLAAILFCLSHALFTPQGVNNAHLLQDSDQSDCFKYQDQQTSTIYTNIHAKNEYELNVPRQHKKAILIQERIQQM